MRSRSPACITGLTLSFLLGVGLAATADSSASDREVAKGQRPAFLIVSWEILHLDQLNAFTEAALPLAQRAGLQMLAVSDPQVLEGKWPYKGIVILQKYPSMQALLDFWNSPAHSKAKKLREAHINTNFVIAVEDKE